MKLCNSIAYCLQSVNLTQSDKKQNKEKQIEFSYVPTVTVTWMFSLSNIKSDSFSVRCKIYFPEKAGIKQAEEMLSCTLHG